MSDLQRVRPAAGRLVRFEDPAQGHIPADGTEVPLTKYYRRRIADGDLLPASRPRPERQPKKEG